MSNVRFSCFLGWKSFAVIFEINIQPVKCICLWHSLGATPQAEVVLICRNDCTVFIPGWLEGEPSLINMTVRECYAPERATFWNTTIVHTQHFCPSGFMFFIHRLIEVKGERRIFEGEQYVLQGLFVTGEVITHALVLKSNPNVGQFFSHPINRL